MQLNDLVSLVYAAEQSGIPYITLKAACQRYAKTKGEYGLQSIKPLGGRDYVTTMEIVGRYPYRPRQQK